MASLYRCDGCEVELPEPTYTIERTDGIGLPDEAGQWHACSWRCVAKVAYQHEVRQGTWPEPSHGS